MFIGVHHSWGALDLETNRLKSRLLADYDHFIALVRSLLREAPEAVRSEVESSDDEIRAIIDQTHLTWHATPDEALSSASKHFEQLLQFVNHLYDSSEGSWLFVPDTNALLYNPALERWSFADVPRFEIILVPTVLSELDQQKVNHRNPEIRERAESLVRRIKEFRSRGARSGGGNLTTGVPLVKNTSSIRAIAREPVVEDSLPWLDPSNSDDRLLASVIEVMRHHPRSSVVLVTRDLSLQNKAEFARLAFLEPPEPLK